MAEYRRLDELCHLNMGQSPDSNSYNESGEGLPFFQGNADFGEQYPTVRVWCNAPSKIVEAGTLLISVRAPIGALNFSTERSCIGRGLAGITPHQGVELKYIYYCLIGKNAELKAKGTGSTFKAIAKNALGETQIKIVPLPKQLEVVQLLDSVSTVIEGRKQQLTELDNLIKARFVELFGEAESNTKAWPILNMCNLCSVGSSKRIYQSEQSSDGVPFWRVSDLTNLINTGIATTDLYIPEERYAEFQRHGQVPVKDDILVTSRGTLGQCYIVKADDKFYFQDGMISWLSNYADNITPLYISYLFTMPGFRKQIDAMQAGSTVAYLSIAMIKKLKVMVPNMELQKQFAAFVAQVEKTKAAVQKALEEAQVLFDSLMQQYFG